MGQLASVEVGLEPRQSLGFLVVRLAKAHTDLALPVCRIPVDQICFVSHGVPVVEAYVPNKRKPGM